MISPIPWPDPLEKFRDFLQSKGMRLSPERESIFIAVYESLAIFDADAWIEKLELRKGGARASRSTVYRTLALMEEAGLIRKLEGPQDK